MVECRRCSVGLAAEEDDEQRASPRVRGENEVLVRRDEGVTAGKLGWRAGCVCGALMLLDVDDV